MPVDLEFQALGSGEHSLLPKPAAPSVHLLREEGKGLSAARLLDGFEIGENREKQSTLDPVILLIHHAISQNLQLQDLQEQLLLHFQETKTTDEGIHRRGLDGLLRHQ